MPPKPAKQQQQQSGRNIPVSPVSASKETDANANNMTALANAVTAVQASINSFREENRASIASLHSILSVYGQRITDVEEAFSESKKKLHAAKIQFALYYPATLQFTHNGRRMKFTDPATALTYVNKNVAADDGSSVSQVTEDGD
ncbi:hypothetical protein F2P81_003886 [Scomber scombrus]|uniref:Uncharacterized protein n=1 Tax=Scomber scombrus TaxID=13677 RepID=A0AAV1QEN4_SCOSC